MYSTIPTLNAADRRSKPEMFFAICATLLVVLATSAICWRRSARTNRISRLRRTILPLLIWSLCGGLFFRILQTPNWTFNGTRLAPAFALTRGYQLYYPPESGPVLETTYAAMTALFYLPTTTLRTPNSAVIVGSLLTVISCFIPLLLLTLRNRRGRLDLSARLFGFLILGLLVLYCEPLRYSCINVHADGPALAFGGMACVCLLRRPHSRAALVCAAILAVMSPWAKQTALPLLGGVALYLVLADGWRTLARFLLLYAAAAVVISSAFMLAFDPRRVWFNLVTVQAKVFVSTGALATKLVQGVRGMVHSGDLIIIAVVIGVVSTLVSHNRGRYRIRSWARRNDWSLLFFVGLFGIPVSILARVKTGGDIDSFSFVLYYFNAAVGMLAAELMQCIRPSAGQNEFSAYQITTMAAVSVVILIEVPTLFGIPQAVHDLNHTDQQVAYYYLRQHAGSAYFPWLPLAHVMAEGKVYHSAFGVVDRELSGNRLSTQHFRSGIPGRAMFVAYRSEGIDNIGGCDLRAYLPEFSTLGTNPDLPGWTILEKHSD